MLILLALYAKKPAKLLFFFELTKYFLKKIQILCILLYFVGIFSLPKPVNALAFRATRREGRLLFRNR